jgi:hypothetical protein
MIWPRISLGQIIEGNAILDRAVGVCTVSV